MTTTAGAAEQIRRRSLELGGDGNVDLHYAPDMPNAGRPWQAVTTVKPRYHTNRRLWVS